MDDVFLTAGFVLVAAALSFYVAGPLGMLVLGLVFVSIGIVAPGSAGTRDDRVNCSECGAVNPSDAETCHYCDSPLDA